MKIRSLAAAILAAAVLAGCGEKATGPLAPAPPAASFVLGGQIDLSGVVQFASLPSLTGTRHAEKWIDASEGGFVELNGFRVDIPAGALPADTTVTIDLPADNVLGKRVLAEFGPHGIQFSTPVTLTFPLSGAVLNSGGTLTVARWEDGDWTELGGTVTANGTRLTGTTPHFSFYAAKYIMAGG